PEEPSRIEELGVERVGGVEVEKLGLRTELDIVVPAALVGGEGEYRVTLRLRTLADALRAFKIAGLVLGSVGFAPMRLLTLVQLRGGWLKAYIAPFIE
ncbi:MAG: hypothetical protein QXT79_04060, partial [Thermofilaceae archaeon]